MQVTRIGFTPLKGGRHLDHESVTLSAEGPVGDRAFCLLDPAADRCLRTIEHPTLLATRALWDGTVLRAELPSGTVAGEPVATGDVREVDYWGRRASVELVDGPWAAAYSAYLGREVVLGRAAPGQVVFGASVTIVTDGSLARLAQQVGAPVDGARLRATFQLDDAGARPFAEDEWVGRRLRLGAAEVEVTGLVGRCAVIDLDPASGLRDLPVLKALAALRAETGGVDLGLYAEVVAPAVVRTGDPASVAPLG
ncbi:MOSC domain-containing protein [Nocardioides houyundeii]|uniref:MOSC domain-containing protein n=1 Tax=Nocardioides houyundeii TaxID=2045452 RepID=UPI000DF181B5|nr:MOSC domain-containing protein [Nocardioides houyundeii]